MGVYCCCRYCGERESLLLLAEEPEEEECDDTFCAYISVIIFRHLGHTLCSDASAEMMPRMPTLNAELSTVFLLSPGVQSHGERERERERERDGWNQQVTPNDTQDTDVRTHMFVNIEKIKASCVHVELSMYHTS